MNNPQTIPQPLSEHYEASLAENVARKQKLNDFIVYAVVLAGLLNADCAEFFKGDFKEPPRINGSHSELNEPESYRLSIAMGKFSNGWASRPESHDLIRIIWIRSEKGNMAADQIKCEVGGLQERGGYESPSSPPPHEWKEAFSITLDEPLDTMNIKGHQIDAIKRALTNAMVSRHFKTLQIKATP